MKTVGVTDYTSRAPSKHFYRVNNHYAKFEYKGMKYVSITDYTQINNVSTPKVLT